MRSFPWDSVATSIGEDGYPVYDRVYQASDLREVYETFFSNGIFTDSETALKVSPGEGMTVRVAPGRCCINGTVGYEEEERELALTASGTMDRIDTVVLRWDSALDARSIDLYVLAGAPSETPVRPTLTRSATVWELGLCDVYVTAHMLQTKSEKMTDTRLDSNRCGVVAPFVKLNTQNFYDQLQAQTQIAVELAQAALDDTIAGQLQNGIDGKVSKSGDTMSGALNLEVPLAIESGGTGDTSAAGARTSLGTPAYIAGANGHFGLANPSGVDTGWCRSPKSGFLPYDSENKGSSQLGAYGWPWMNVWTQKVSIDSGGSIAFGNATYKDNFFVDSNALTLSLVAKSLASQGTANVTGTLTLPAGIEDYWLCLATLDGCVGYCSTQKSGNTLTITATVRNVRNVTANVAIRVFVVTQFKGILKR